MPMTRRSMSRIKRPGSQIIKPQTVATRRTIQTAGLSYTEFPGPDYANSLP